MSSFLQLPIIVYINDPIAGNLESHISSTHILFDDIYAVSDMSEIDDGFEGEQKAMSKVFVKPSNHFNTNIPKSMIMDAWRYAVEEKESNKLIYFFKNNN